MTRNEMLLLKVMEECAEVAQRVSKALCFGMSEVQPGQEFDNKTRIMAEFTDLVATMEMAGLHPRSLDEDALRAKKVKVEKYVKYSESCGMVAEETQG